MNRDAALRKVLACLRLAKSANANEAAMALRQARALMREYGLSEDDAWAAEITSADASTSCKASHVPVSVAWLVNIVAAGYGCKTLARFTPGRAVRVEFFGAGVDAKIAAYAFTVLFRQMDAARLAHIKRVRKRSNRAARGEVFAQAWVAAVAALFPAMELTADRTRAIERAVDTAAPGWQTREGRDLTTRGETRSSDALAGHLAGRSARLHQGIEGGAQRRLGHG